MMIAGHRLAGPSGLRPDGLVQFMKLQGEHWKQWRFQLDASIIERRRL